MIHAGITRIVLGNGSAWASDCVIAHRVMRDATGLPAAIGALADAGLKVAGGGVLAVIARQQASHDQRS
jgi:hypothetical protein